MNDILLRDYGPDDKAAILRMNHEFVSVLSPMDADRFEQLRHGCCLLKVAEIDGGVAGFMLGFADGSDYDSVNYRWFADRLKRFFYVDRIVVDSGFRGAGLGHRLYAQADRWANEEDLAWMTAEIDLQPPNPGSLAFHQRLGFVEVGQQVTRAGKQVSLQLRPVGAWVNPLDNP